LTQIEKTQEGFDFHTTEDHNLWYYLFFMYYLKKKPTPFTGIEAEIAQKISKDDHSWFPIGKSLKLAASDDTETVADRVDKACAAIDGLISDYREIRLAKTRPSN
jgi:hypothetical protein